MKKILTKLYVGLLSVPAVSAAADEVSPGECPAALGGGPACDDLVTNIQNISNTILLLVGVIAVLFLIIGGFQYIASGGNPEQVGKAKNTIFYAIIGILVTLLAYVIVQFILGRFTS